ncbi:MAG: DUF2231 domain-containing protein [Deltaproteobacteria bacterium]|nr:DUF2231 domain-containing protein [Deltaproteobacteria bacterium]
METLAHFHFQTVHFPVALTLASLLFALLGQWRKNESLFAASRFTLYLATLGAIAAVTTGLMAEEYLPHEHEGIAREIMEEHETLGLSIAGGLVLASIISLITERKRWIGGRKIVLIFLFILSSAVAVTGYLGGRLGHEFGIGIKKEEAPAPMPMPMPATNDEETPHGDHDHEGHQH